MTTATITKTLKKVNNTIELSKTDNFYKASLGFHRMQALPTRVRKNIGLACIMKGENNTNSMINLFNDLTDLEFINWLKLA